MSAHSNDDILRRVPPHNLEAEQSVLGAILLMGAAYANEDAATIFAEQARTIAEAQAILRVEDFYREAHREIFGCMIELNQRKVTVDAITLSDILRSKGVFERIGGAVYVAELAAFVPTAVNLAHYARIIREKAVLRALASVATEIAAGAYDAPLDVGVFLADAEARIGSVTQIGIGNPDPPFCDAVHGLLQAVERGELAGVPSGFRVLDEMLAGGGFTRGSLNIIAATTSVGKTALAANIAVRVQRGGTLFFSVEMSRDQMIQRLIADLGKVDWASIARRRPPQPDDDESARIAQGAARLLDFPIDVLHRRELTPMMVRREARLTLQRFDGKLDLIIIDYLQLMDADSDEKRHRDRRDLEIGSITKALKSIASEFDCPVLLLSQVNRDAVKTPSGEPELWHLRDSGAIEQDADVVIFIWESRGKADENENDVEVEWKIAKQRNGPKTRLLPSLCLERDITRFRS